MDTRAYGVDDPTGPSSGTAGDQAPDSIEQPALSLDRAARLMGRLGFLAFRTPADVPGTDSCLMVVIRDAPTRRHYDPVTVRYWMINKGHGLQSIVDRATQMPMSRGFSWGRIRIEDRFGVGNDFVSLGGWLTGERVGSDATLLIFRSAAPILRLGGHSQPCDALAGDVLVFFSRLLPRLWADPDSERRVGEVPPEQLWAAFLLDMRARIERSIGHGGAPAPDGRAVRRELDRMGRLRPEAMRAGAEFLVSVTI
jgi:hypothetical protein